MSRITLVRHAQASFLEPNYDQLCANGEKQAHLLGEYWARNGASFCCAWSGPCVRQLQTARIVEQEYRRLGREFPGLEVVSEFNEYPGEAVMRQGLPHLIESSGEVRSAHQVFENSNEIAERKRAFQRLFEAVIERWVRGELTIAGTETWKEFCARVDRGLARVEIAKSKLAEKKNTGGSGETVVFTSGGPIAVAMRRALRLSDADTLQMTWMSRNASFSEFLSSGDRFTLSTFNATPHLNDEALLTYR